MTTETKPAAKPADKADPAAKAIQGENQEISLVDQVKKARGEEKKIDDKGGKVDGKITSLAEEALTPVEKLRGAGKDAREEHLKSLGIDPANPGGSGLKKVEPSGTSDKMYKGLVTVTGQSGEFHQKISARIDLGPTPRGEAWIRDHAFKEHFPSFDRDAGITIDEDNLSDPMLRTQYE